jgi:hypothetical protein
MTAGVFLVDRRIHTVPQSGDYPFIRSRQTSSAAIDPCPLRRPAGNQSTSSRVIQVQQRIPGEILLSTPRLFVLYFDLEDNGTEARSPSDIISRSAKAAGIPTHVPLYAATVDAMDQAIGQVLDTLNKDGLAENSTVFFFSAMAAIFNAIFCQVNLQVLTLAGYQWRD